MVRRIVLLLAVTSFALVACNALTGAADLGEMASTSCFPLADGTKITDQAVTADGRYVTVLGSGLGARLFYGAAEHMDEGHITGASVGCFQSYDFSVGPTAYTAYLGYPSCGGNILTRLYREGVPSFERMKLVTAFGAPVTEPDPIGGAVTDAAPASNPTFYCF